MGRPPAYQKEKLLEEIVACLWKQGYASTPISTLIQNTGVNAASLYALFGSKKGMMLAALEAYAQETSQELTMLLAREKPGRRQIQALLEHILEASLADPQARGCFLVNSILEANPEAPDIAGKIAEYMEGLRAILAAQLALAPDLQPGLSAGEAALFLQTQIWGLKLMARMGPSRELGQSVIRQTIRTLFIAREE